MTLLTLELKRTELLNQVPASSYRLVQEVDKQIADTRASIASEGGKPLRDAVTDQNPTYSWIGTGTGQSQGRLQPGCRLPGSGDSGDRRQCIRTNARQLEEKDLAQHDLARTAKADEDNYLLYLRKREEARMADALDEQRILNVAIVDTPSIPSLPTGNRLQYALIGLLLASTLSVGVVFTIEYLDPSLRTPSEVMSELNIPVLAAVPPERCLQQQGQRRP